MASHDCTATVDAQIVEQNSAAQRLRRGVVRGLDDGRTASGQVRSGSRRRDTLKSPKSTLDDWPTASDAREVRTDGS